MDQIRKKNEEKIFLAIQNLKDSIFGLKQPFTEFCFSTTKNEIKEFDEKKMNLFINELNHISKNTTTYNIEFDSIIPIYFEMSLRFIIAACNANEWQFLSIKRISETIYKDANDPKSTFDYMVENATSYLNERWPNGEFNQLYEKYTLAFSNMNYEKYIDFCKCIKHTIERFIDTHFLNALSDDNETEAIIKKINYTASRIQKEWNDTRSASKND